MKHPPILDFTTDGNAVVNISDVGDMAYLDMFGFSPISKLEDDILHADTLERKRFLEKFLRVYLEMYGEDNNEKWSKEISAFEESVVRNILAIATENCSYEDCMEDEQLNKAWEAIEHLNPNVFVPDDVPHSDCLSEEITKAWEAIMKGDASISDYKELISIDERVFDKQDELNEEINKLSFQVLKIRGYVLKHSTAWYMFGNVDVDIKAAKLHIEQEIGLLMIIDNLDGFVEIVRKSNETSDAQQKLQEKLGLTEIQAKYVISLKLMHLTELSHRDVRVSMNKYEKRLVFLEKICKD